ncbi:hypothetical protein IE53DRAFT_369066 [Violaceomyces palustris]|uniref:Uncharacterized protein n=1 Tax=Violaceomyces palustris TaxID=1673888 RepID=A0ACD0NWP7_9BASI|nr:hypothetical protein IE53DRAFT_369066 [Violaceomyces palustris]
MEDDDIYGVPAQHPQQGRTRKQSRGARETKTATRLWSSSSSEPKRSASSSTKKSKINAVSKASLAMLDPRHAMGMDIGTEWCDSPTRHYSSEFEDQIEISSRGPSPVWRESEDDSVNSSWTASPTPTLEAFAMPDFSVKQEAIPEQEAVSIASEPEAFSSVFEDDREGDQRRFPSISKIQRSQYSEPSLSSPAKSTKAAKSSKSGGLPSSSSSSSSLARFFTWKRSNKDKTGNLSSRSTTDLFDSMPASAPPTTTTFDLSHDPIMGRNGSHWNGSADDGYSSLPTSPVKENQTLPNILLATHAASPHHDSGSMSRKQSMPSLREQRKGYMPAVNASSSRSLYSSEGGEQSSHDFKVSQNLGGVPALPPLPSDIGASSPIIPRGFGWGLSGDDEPNSPRSRPISRAVSSTGRGVPSPRIDSMYDRKSILISKQSPSPSSKKNARSKQTGVKKDDSRRMSMAQQVVDGLLSQSRGHEEPAPRARAQVKAMRRRSRSVDSRAPPPLSSFGSPPAAFSPASPEIAIFPSLARHRGFNGAFPMPPSTVVHGIGRGRPRATDTSSSGTPTQKTISSFPQPQTQRAIEFDQLPEEGETHQARRVNLSNQRARAVPVASPLLSRSPRPNQVPLVVTVMPPTPDLHNEETAAFESPSSEDSVCTPGSRAQSEEMERWVAPDSSARDTLHQSVTGHEEPSIVQQAVLRNWSREPAGAIMSPESVYSPSSDYSPPTNTMTDSGPSHFSSLGEGAPEPPSSRERITSYSSETSDVSTGSSNSGAFAFSRSLSNNSLRSGGTFSSASSLSGSPARFSDRETLPALSPSSSGFSSHSLGSSTSLSSAMSATTTSTSILDFGSEQAHVFQQSTLHHPEDFAHHSKPAHEVQLRTPFHFQSAMQLQNVDSDDCETPKLSSNGVMMPAFEMPAQGNHSQTQAVAIKPVDFDSSPQLQLSLEIQQLSLGLALGGDMTSLRNVGKKRTSPPKPPKSRARANSTWTKANNLPPINTSMPVSKAPAHVQGRSPITPPRTPASAAHKAAFNQVQSGLGLGLGLDFGEVGSGNSHMEPEHFVAAAPIVHQDEWSHGVARNDWKHESGEWEMGVAM